MVHRGEAEEWVRRMGLGKKDGGVDEVTVGGAIGQP